MSPFQSKPFRRLFSAQITSLIGTGLSSVALALLAWQMAGEQAGSVLGIALALKMIAYVFIAPVVGGLAHRMPRKRLLISLDIVRALLIGCLPWVSEIWHIYVLMFAINACAAGFTPLFQATIPDLFTNDKVYTKALSYARLAYDLENLLSPTLAALLLTWVGFYQLFYLNSLTFLLSAILIAFTLLPKSTAHDRPLQIWHNIQFGISAYLRTPRLRALWALYFAVAAAGGMVIVNTVVYVQGHLQLGQQTLAQVLMASGAGSMLAALWVPYLRHHFADRSIMLTGGLLLGLALTLGTRMLPLAGLYLLWFVMGLGSSLIQTPAGNLLRRSCRPGDSAAFFAANFSLSHLGWLVGYLLAGWLGTELGLSWAFGVLASMAWVALLIAWQQYPKQDQEDLWHTHTAMHHTHPHQHDQHHDHGHHHQHASADQHMHTHQHKPLRHKHTFVIDQHHPRWPD
ncbi:MAG: MFS transporter [Gammaproteobacteria bacterium]|jgi:MFS family permease|nr:MFS transporter [Gammaproteobacteria bacterium]